MGADELHPGVMGFGPEGRVAHQHIQGITGRIRKEKFGNVKNIPYLCADNESSIYIVEYGRYI